MTKKNELIEIRKKLSKVLFNFEEVIDTNNITIIYDGVLEVGTELFTYDEAGEKIVLSDGEYTIMIDEKEVIIVVIEGKVSEIKNDQVIEDQEETSTDIPVEDEIIDDQEQFNFEEKIKEVELRFDEKIKNLTDVITNLVSTIQKYSEQSVDEPIVPSKNDETFETKKDKKDPSRYFSK